MRLASLGSGSSGNATLVDAGAGKVLVDCGLSAKELERRLAQLELGFEDICAVLVTHEHADHIGGVTAVANRCAVPVYCTQGTAKKLGRVEQVCIRAEQEFHLADSGMDVLPVAVPHDAREPVQFVFRCGDRKLGILTDLGSGTPHIAELYANCETLLIEANHDREMLLQGSYPAALKRRILSNWGHLSNDQTSALLEQIFSRGKTPDTLVLGHISLENNHTDRVQQSMQTLPIETLNLHFACQGAVLPWVGTSI